MRSIKEVPVKEWSQEEATKLYCFDKWGEGYFHLNDRGNIEVIPYRNGNAVDLHEIVQTLVRRGIEAPVLIRFDGIIQDRLERISAAFAHAIDLYSYDNSYRHVFPLKVNQQKHVVDSIRRAGRDHHSGVEVGSKPELLAILTMPDDGQSLFLCNGYKDEEYIELALLSKKLGKRTIIIIEQLYECTMILKTAKKFGIEAEVGFRMQPSAKGSGRWASSGGELAKFGLNTHELLSAYELFASQGKAHWIKLLHFHIGSQLSSIIPFKKTLAEAARFYAELAIKCPSIDFFDVGGGLGVDYDGSKTVTDSSMNYTIEEYARDIVYTVGEICKERQVPAPVLVSESGRALVAHHSVLVTEVIDVSQYNTPFKQLKKPLSKSNLLNDLSEIYHSLSKKNYLEVLHDAHFIKQQVLEQFIYGGITLAERAYVEHVYRNLVVKTHALYQEVEDVHEDLEALSKQLMDIYFCNFSVFQSLPDAWAIDQLFPVMPIHRLNKRPTRKAKIVDLSCDSDGTIERFISQEGPVSHIQLHELESSKPYYLGVFLVGAYQEALGGLHNLFGDTNAIHVDLHEDGTWGFKNLIEGDTIREVLQYMQYDSQELVSKLHHSIERALRQKLITEQEASMIKKKYKASLENYTYLVT
ncbi:MAG: biosynthetic arginine decarboxylase [Chlamydiota bacterium]